MNQDPVILAMSASLAYASYTMATCPCKTPCKCKLPVFLTTVGVPLAYVLYTNFLQ